MVLDFVSLVPAGDNPGANVVISKAAPNSTAHQEDRMGDTSISKDDLDPEVVEYIDGLEAEVDDLSKSVESVTAERDGLVAERDSLKKSLDDAEASGAVIKSEDEQRKAMLAKADPAIRALIEKQEADLAEVKKAADAERDARLTREFIAKAETMPMVAEDRTALGGLLRRLSEALSPEDTAEVEKILKAANEQIAQGNVFREFGVDGGAVTVSKSVEAAAQAIQKEDPSLTFEQAQAKAFERNPGLLTEAMTTGQEG